MKTLNRPIVATEASPQTNRGGGGASGQVAGRFAGRNVAIVSNAGWNIANFRFPIAHAIQREGGRVVAMAPEDEDAQRIRNAGIEFVPLRTLKRSGTNPWRDYLLLRELRSLYRTHEIDLAIHYTIKPVIYGSLAAGRLPTRSISVITGLGYAFIHGGMVNRIVRSLYRRSLKRCDSVVFQNRDDFQEFRTARLVDPAKATVIRGSGVSTEAFQPVYPVGAGGKLRFVFVGRLLHDKGIREFLAASQRILEDYPDVQIDVVGSIDPDNPASMTQAEVDQWANLPGLHFHGYATDVRAFLRHADVVVLPSYREGLPRAITEAMAMGKPCLTTDVPGCRDTVVDGESGFVVEAESGPAVEAGMRKFIGLSNETLCAMGKAGRRRAEAYFSDDVVLAQYTALIDASLNPATHF